MTKLELSPAPLGPRILAGAFDLGVSVALAVALFLLPLLTRGLVLPMVAVFAAVLVTSIVPLWLFRATLGMRLTGLSLVGLDGHEADLADVIFREMLGRGLFPAAYLGTVGLGLLASAFGVLGFRVPIGLGLLLFAVSSLLLAAAIAGHFVALGRADRRHLADLLAKTQVIVRPATAPAEDPEDRAFEEARARRRVRGYATFALVTVVGTALLPILLAGSTSVPGERAAARWERDKAEAAFRKDPADLEAARDYADRLFEAGEPEEAERVLARQREAYASREAERERSLLERFGRDPADQELAGKLVSFYEDADRLDDAQAIWERWVGANPTGQRRAAYGAWLYRAERPEASARELSRALEEGFDDPETRAYLGLALLDQGRRDEARTELARAVAEDPELEAAAEVLRSLDEGSTGASARQP